MVVSTRAAQLGAYDDISWTYEVFHPNISDVDLLPFINSTRIARSCSGF
jgi:hypothetical protein